MLTNIMWGVKLIGYRHLPRIIFYNFIFDLSLVSLTVIICVPETTPKPNPNPNPNP